MLNNSLHEILLRIVMKQCDVIESISATILQFFKEIKQDIRYFISAIKIIQFMEINKLNYCFPNFVNSHKPTINALGLYDIGLATYINCNQIKNTVIENDFNYNSSNIFFVSGINQGGKTTFLRSIGVSQLFAQAGLVVPANEYSCTVFNTIISYFNKSEDTTLEKGKFKEELIRLKDNLKLLDKSNLILFNEPFSSTTTMIRVDLSLDIIKALSHTNSIIIFVTHLYELTRRVNELNDFMKDNAKITNLVSLIKEDNRNIVRHFKIVPGEPTKYIDIHQFEESITIKN
ncbi:hypothetical protein KHQ81_00170 [Mycoplasmatota bacterium]|nr:hypothetical protein KHQ81_00170 [Mycoplasmatota bacterium]